MRALVFHDIEQVGVVDVAEPELIGPGDAIVKVTHAAICGSDLHPYHGREKGLDRGTPMGHEFVGRVVERGPDVTSIDVGQSVYSPFTTSCGQCRLCRMGLTCRCPKGQLFGWISKGHGLAGGQAEYVRVPNANGTLKSIPAHIDQRLALLMGDIMATGTHCARMAGVEPGGVYAVIGCGPVGLMAIAAARRMGASRIFAMDRVSDRLEQAQAWGATPVYSEPAGIARVVKATGGLGVDGVMEAVGSRPAAMDALGLVRPGGRISIVGVHTDPQFGFSPGDCYDKNLTLSIGRCPARAIMDELEASDWQSDPIDYLSLFTHRIPLSEGPRGYQIFDGKLDGCLKVLLEIG